MFVTNDNLSSEWLHFEAGALSRVIEGSVERGRVTPFLVGVKESDLRGALKSFQATNATEDDVRRLVEDINDLSEHPLSNDLLQHAFSKNWPDLAAALETLLSAPSTPPIPDAQANPDSILEDLVSLVRDQGRTLIRLEQLIDADRYGTDSQALDYRKLDTSSSRRRQANARNVLVHNLDGVLTAANLHQWRIRMDNDGGVSVTVPALPDDFLQRPLENWANENGLELRLIVGDATFSFYGQPSSP